MNKLFKKILSLFTITVFIFGFATPALADSVVGPGKTPIEYDLHLGSDNKTVVGKVKVWNDSTNLYVQYNTIDKWYMTENQLDVITKVPGAEDTKPGQFTYKRDSTNSIQTYTFTVPQSAFSGAAEVYILAHTKVTESGAYKGTAWGGNISGISDNKWF